MKIQMQKPVLLRSNKLTSCYWIQNGDRHMTCTELRTKMTIFTNPGMIIASMQDLGMVSNLYVFFLIRVKVLQLTIFILLSMDIQLNIQHIQLLANVPSHMKIDMLYWLLNPLQWAFYPTQFPFSKKCSSWKCVDKHFKGIAAFCAKSWYHTVMVVEHSFTIKLISSIIHPQ